MPNSICFQLLGQPFGFSFDEFNQELGFTGPEDSITEPPEDWNVEEAYKRLIGDEAYNASIEQDKKKKRVRKPIMVQDTELRFINRLIASNYSGKSSAASNFSNSKIFFLDCMQQEKSVNLAFWISFQMNRMHGSKRILFGSIITRLADQVQGYDLALLSPIPPQTPTFRSFDDMGFFNMYANTLFVEPGFTTQVEHVSSKIRKGKFEFIDLHSAKAKTMLQEYRQQLANAAERIPGIKPAAKTTEKKKGNAVETPSPTTKSTQSLLKLTPPTKILKDRDRQGA